MTEILIHEKSFDRIAPALAARAPGVTAVRWDPDGALTRENAPVDPDKIAPSVGWIGSDILAGRQMRPYVEALLRYDTVKWVQSANAGLDHEVYRKLAARGVRVTKSGAQSIPIAEYVLAYALERYQKFDERRAAQSDKVWRAHRFRELWHATWVIIGYGHIGRGVARRAKSFDSKVIAVRRSGAQDEYADVVTTLAALPEHLPQANIVVLACPANEATHRLANADFFARLGEDVLLINVARGSLVDEEALLRGLDRGRPAHAVLDVFAKEPLPGDSALWTHPGVTVTAHTSNAGGGTRERGDELFLSNLEHFLADRPLADEVDRSEIID